jgi:hypothetical protein
MHWISPLKLSIQIYRLRCAINFWARFQLKLSVKTICWNCLLKPSIQTICSNCLFMPSVQTVCSYCLLNVNDQLFYETFSSPSLLALQLFVDLHLLRGFVTVNIHGIGRYPHVQTLTWRTRGYTFSCPYPMTRLAWVALPGAYAPTSIALRAMGAQTSFPR